MNVENSEQLEQNEDGKTQVNVELVALQLAKQVENRRVSRQEASRARAEAEPNNYFPSLTDEAIFDPGPRYADDETFTAGEQVDWVEPVDMPRIMRTASDARGPYSEEVVGADMSVHATSDRSVDDPDLYKFKYKVTEKLKTKEGVARVVGGNEEIGTYSVTLNGTEITEANLTYPDGKVKEIDIDKDKELADELAELMQQHASELEK